MFFCFFFIISLQRVSDDGRLIAPPKEQGKAKVVYQLTRAAQTSNNYNMTEDLQQVADLITANTIFTTKEVLTSDEAARYLGVSKSCLYKWTMSRQIPHYKSPSGKLCFFNRGEIEAWMQSIKVQTDEELQKQAQKLSKKGGKK